MKRKEYKEQKAREEMEEKKLAKGEEVSPENTPESGVETHENRQAVLEAEVAQWKDKYLRTMAEFENFRRRTQQEKSDWVKWSTEKLILTICDVMDNFERAIPAEAESSEDPFVKGIVLIKQQLMSVLEKEEVKKVEALGQDFDPNYHEALAHIPSELEENKVAAVIQNGYQMHGKLIRPVRVAVSNGMNLQQELKTNKEDVEE